MIDNKKIHVDIDTKLMLLAKEEDKEAFAELYIRNISNTVRYFTQVGKTDGSSEDLAHEVFMRIWQKKKDFSGKFLF